jgi:polyisoprenoid-binding protein YceI
MQAAPILKTASLALALTALSLPSWAGTGPSALASAPASSLKILGDSTLHTWTVNAKSLSVTASLKASKDEALLEGVAKGGMASLSVTVGVEGLKSTESSGMDKNMDKALESDKFPEISFVMKSYSLKDGQAALLGSLSIHGVAKDVSLTGQVSAKAPGMEVKGSYDLLMSDYGVKPPVMMLGTVRVKDKVSIVYDLELDPASPAEKH